MRGVSKIERREERDRCEDVEGAGTKVHSRERKEEAQRGKATSLIE